MDLQTKLSAKTLGDMVNTLRMQGYFESDDLEQAINQLLNDPEKEIGLTFQNVEAADQEIQW